MFDYNKSELADLAEQYHFVRDTLEKVIRLSEVLSYINKNAIMKNSLVLKGGTAINLTIMDLPRLSIDIDLDFCENIDKETMLSRRTAITKELEQFMLSQGYSPSQHSKHEHSLDSFVYSYRNLGDASDNLKIEINYSLRSHLFNPVRRRISTELLDNGANILTLEPVEIYAAKINALLSRSTARDLYDTYNMINQGFLDGQFNLLRKCVVIYTAISQKSVPERYDFNKINNITFSKIRSDLLPVIKRGEFVDLDKIKNTVTDFLSEILVLTPSEADFLNLFKRGTLKPELVFSDEDIIERIISHPMLQWKVANNATEDLFTSTDYDDEREEDDEFDLEY